MNKILINIVGIIILMSTSGCVSKTEYLTCTSEKENAGFNDKTTINITYKNNEITDLDMETKLQIIEKSEDESLEDIKEIFDLVYEDISLNEGINISAKLENDNIIINAEIKYSSLKEEGQNRVSGTIVPAEVFEKKVAIKEMKANLEKNGYSCKIENK